MKRKTHFQLRQEYLNRSMEELDPDLIRQMTGHKSVPMHPAYRMLLVGNRPVESHLVYDKPDLKKLRRLLKSQTRSARSPHRGTRS